MKGILTFVWICWFMIGLNLCSNAQIIANSLDVSFFGGFESPIGKKEIKKTINEDYSFMEPLFFSNLSSSSFISLRLSMKVLKGLRLGFEYKENKMFSDWSSNVNNKYEYSQLAISKTAMVLGIGRSFSKGSVYLVCLPGISFLEYNNIPSHYMVNGITKESNAVAPQDYITYNVIKSEKNSNFSVAVEIGGEYILHQNFSLKSNFGYGYIVTSSTVYYDTSFQSVFGSIGLCIRLFKDKRFSYK